jgi:hypothetical protein
MKRTVNHFIFEKLLAKRGELQPGYRVDPIIEDAVMTMADAMNAAGDDETRERYAERWLDDRAELFVVRVPIPVAKATAAFGDAPTLAGQAVLVKTYGEPAAKAEAERWGTALGSLNPGTAPGETVDKATLHRAVAKVRADDETAPSRNPWSAAWPRDKDRVVAQTAIIKSMGSAAAVRFARAAGVTLTGQPLRK